MIKAGMSFVAFRRFFLSPSSLVVIIAFSIFHGCTGLPRKSEKDTSPLAQALIHQLSQQNTNPPQLKGLGGYRLVNAEGRISGRMGWACRRLDQFRADILDFGGRPAATIASDGRWLYARIKGERKIHKRSSTAAVFRKMIGSPVSANEIIAFLSGRVPLRKHQTAVVSVGKDQGPILILKGNSNRLLEEVYFNKDTSSPERVVVFAKSGGVAYQVDLGLPAEQDGYTFFQTLSFSTKNGNRFDLQVDKMWFDVDFSNSLFELKDP